MRVEFYYSENILLTGDVVQVDASFSHEHGIKADKEIELKDFKIYVDDGWHQYEMTKEIETKRPDRYKEYSKSLLEFYEGKRFGEAG